MGRNAWLVAIGSVRGSLGASLLKCGNRKLSKVETRHKCSRDSAQAYERTIFDLY